MITCPNCQHSYQKQPRCPSCGEPAPLFSKQGRTLALVGIAAVLIAAFLFASGSF
jgi:uncharacterized paraquat-inducible protein A